MKILYDLPDYQEQTVVALGNFDGVHLGHRKLITECVELARQQNALSVVVTFEPHPIRILYPEREFKTILNKNKKTEIISKLGVDILIYLTFDMSMAALKADEFAKEILHDKLNAKHVFVGFNYTFGAMASGNTRTLKELSSKLDFKLQVIKPVKIEQQVVSSSSIRKMLLEGKIEKAKQFLGYWPVLYGKVVLGRRVGRKIGFPTANLRVGQNILVPKSGVYASKIMIDNQEYLGMTNIGQKPTFGYNLPQTIEVNIFNFDQDIYGQELEISLVKRLRNEQKFHSPERLQKQLEQDRKDVFLALSRS
ncbi:bifunctional riboflavin kinase/FAD synthetase [Bacillota bacterium LX-D]|nr:bifunctional riboflavin kinase/FAD synthetase [Bacillota bacterium LX-D]